MSAIKRTLHISKRLCASLIMQCQQDLLDKLSKQSDRGSRCLQTLAALALLFALHAWQPAPFFVLDEVDAALDAGNVARVAAYIRARTRPDATPKFQSVVISLKDAFFHQADALVGVARDHSSAASGTLTFDLSRFPF